LGVWGRRWLGEFWCLGISSLEKACDNTRADLCIARLHVTVELDGRSLLLGTSHDLVGPRNNNHLAEAPCGGDNNENKNKFNHPRCTRRRREAATNTHRELWGSDSHLFLVFASCGSGWKQGQNVHGHLQPHLHCLQRHVQIHSLSTAPSRYHEGRIPCGTMLLAKQTQLTALPLPRDSPSLFAHASASVE